MVIHVPNALPFPPLPLPPPLLSLPSPPLFPPLSLSPPSPLSPPYAEARVRHKTQTPPNQYAFFYSPFFKTPVSFSPPSLSLPSTLLSSLRLLSVEKEGERVLRSCLCELQANWCFMASLICCLRENKTRGETGARDREVTIIFLHSLFLCFAYFL